jgi:glyoxylase-like metal-dependent hydrolase (beta-lactamase superfamily II)
MSMVTDLAPDLRCVQADNPGPLTGSGTNTWLVGRGDVTVIDPGPALPGHLGAILGALGKAERITRILVTHCHLDHSALVQGLVDATGARTFGFGSAQTGRSVVMAALAARGLASGGEGLDTGFVPDVALAQGDWVGGEGARLQAIHTPGHAATHLCFAYGHLLFSGDHVMGWSSSLISPPDGDMAQYMASLSLLAERDWKMALPGHGPLIDAPNTRIATLIAHRRAREAAVLQALNGGAPMRLGEVTAAVYVDVPPALHAAARRNVLAHVIDLHARNMIHADDLCARDPVLWKA